MQNWGLALVFLGACGTSSSKPAASKPFELIGRDWTIPPGTEFYKCMGITADRDMNITELSTANPIGEHHAVITIADQPGGFGQTKLGEQDCVVGTLDLEMLFASGVGTDSLTLPEGVAMPIKAGQFVHLNVHLFNSTDQEISGHTSILVSTVDTVDPAKIAEMVFSGTTNISVPPGQTMTTSGGCTFSRDATMFAYWPHMHRHATHQKLTLTQGGVAKVLHDDAFDFTNQINFPLDPMIAIHSGDAIATECTYTNNDATTVSFGDSSTEEMCFTGLYRYPKQAVTLFDCTTQ